MGRVKNLVHFSICACHPCAGAMLIFSVSFQFYRMIPEGNPGLGFRVEGKVLMVIMSSVRILGIKDWIIAQKEFPAESS